MNTLGQTVWTLIPETLPDIQNVWNLVKIEVIRVDKLFKIAVINCTF